MLYIFHKVLYNHLKHLLEILVYPKLELFHRKRQISMGLQSAVCHNLLQYLTTILLLLFCSGCYIAAVNFLSNNKTIVQNPLWFLFLFYHLYEFEQSTFPLCHYLCPSDITLTLKYYGEFKNNVQSIQSLAHISVSI